MLKAANGSSTLPSTICFMALLNLFMSVLASARTDDGVDPLKQNDDADIIIGLVGGCIRCNHERRVLSSAACSLIACIIIISWILVSEDILPLFYIFNVTCVNEI